MYTLLAEDMEEAGLQEAETYFSHFHNKVAQLIGTRTVMDLCLEAERHTGSQVAN